MKKLLLSILLTALFWIPSNAQGNFAPVGTIWHYSIEDWATQISYPVIVESTDTVTVGGKLCRKIEVTGQVCTLQYTYYIYDINDSVFIYLQSSNSFGLLYDFNAQQGDTLNLSSEPSGQLSQFVTVVDSVGTININGSIRKLISWHTDHTNWSGGYPLEMYGPVIEGLGDMSFLLPQVAVCDPQPAGLRCYQDSIIGLYITGLAPECDTVFTVGIDKFSVFTLQIYPNPVFNSAEIRSHQEFLNATIGVFDMNGRPYYADKNFTGNEYKFDASALPPGVYSLKIADRQKTHVTKLIKM